MRLVNGRRTHEGCGDEETETALTVADRQTRDLLLATFDFEGKSIAWEGRSFPKRGSEGGTLIIEDGGYRILDMTNKGVSRVAGKSD